MLQAILFVFIGSGIGFADEGNDANAPAMPLIRDEYRAIQSDFQKAAVAARADRRAVQAAMESRRNRLQDLLKKSEPVDPASLGAEGNAILAQLAFDLRRMELALERSRLALEMDPERTDAFATLIRALLEQAEVEAADEAYSRFVALKPRPMERAAVLVVLVKANEKVGRPLVAAEYQAGLLEAQVDQSASETALRSTIHDLARLAREAGKPQIALTAIDAALEKTQDRAELQAQISGQRIALLAESGKHVEARAALFEALEAAKNDAETAPEDPVKQRLLGRWLTVRATTADRLEPSQRTNWQDEERAFLKAAAARFPSESTLLDAWMATEVRAVQQLAQEQRLDDAGKVLDSARAFLTELQTGVEDSKPIDAVSRRFEAAVRSTAQAIRLAQLVGQPATPWEADAWVNGSPVSLTELRGKVVLLDFWAVWCGPCIRTFPHLRELHGRHADDGLVILGFTKYCQYGWDEEAARPVRQENLSPEEELAALEQFAHHHDLKYRMALFPRDTPLFSQYGVSGIPHVVVLDRNGVVRLIRVGASEANAKEIHDTIERLLREPAGSASR